MVKVDEEIINGAFVCLAICAADGFISSEEEEVLESSFLRLFGISKEEFQRIIDLFFEDSREIEAFLDTVHQKRIRAQLLEIAESAAAADGLDITENIAWNKCNLYWSN